MKTKTITRTVIAALVVAATLSVVAGDGICYLDMRKVWGGTELTATLQARVTAAMAGGNEAPQILELKSALNDARERVKKAAIDGLKSMGYAVVIDASKMPPGAVVGGVDMTDEAVRRIASGEFALPPVGTVSDSGR